MSAELRITDTNSVNDSKGRALGLEGNDFLYVIGGFVAAFACYLLLDVLLGHQPFLVQDATDIGLRDPQRLEASQHIADAACAPVRVRLLGRHHALPRGVHPPGHIAM